MAIDTNEPIREARVRNADGTITVIRVGIESGRVVVEEDGVIRQATQSEINNYYVATAQDELDTAIATRAGAIDVPAPTPLAIKEYLKLKFPEDFS